MFFPPHTLPSWLSRRVCVCTSKMSIVAQGSGLMGNYVVLVDNDLLSESAQLF